MIRLWKKVCDANRKATITGGPSQLKHSFELKRAKMLTSNEALLSWYRSSAWISSGNLSGPAAADIARVWAVRIAMSGTKPFQWLNDRCSTHCTIISEPSWIKASLSGLQECPECFMLILYELSPTCLFGSVRQSASFLWLWKYL